MNLYRNIKTNKMHQLSDNTLKLLPNKYDYVLFVNTEIKIPKEYESKIKVQPENPNSRSGNSENINFEGLRRILATPEPESTKRVPAKRVRRTKKSE
jgi:hypothetical protein